MRMRSTNLAKTAPNDWRDVGQPQGVVLPIFVIFTCIFYDCVFYGK